MNPYRVVGTRFIEERDNQSMLAVMKNLPGLMQGMKIQPDRLQALQLRRLRSIITHAYEQTVYYRETMDSLGIKPRDIHNLADLQYFPVINRADVKEHFTDMLARGVDVNACKVTHSSGTTGEPVEYAYDGYALNFARAIKVREKLWCGV